MSEQTPLPPMPPSPPGTGVEVTFHAGEHYGIATTTVLPRKGDIVELTVDDKELSYVVDEVRWFVELPDGLDPDVADSATIEQIIVSLEPR